MRRKRLIRPTHLAKSIYCTILVGLISVAHQESNACHHPANCLNSALPLTSAHPASRRKATAAAHRCTAAHPQSPVWLPREIKHFRLQHCRAVSAPIAATRPETNPSMANHTTMSCAAVFSPLRVCATPPLLMTLTHSHLHLCQQQQHTEAVTSTTITSSARLTCSSTWRPVLKSRQYLTG